MVKNLLRNVYFAVLLFVLPLTLMYCLGGEKRLLLFFFQFLLLVTVIFRHKVGVPWVQTALVVMCIGLEWYWCLTNPTQLYSLNALLGYAFNLLLIPAALLTPPLAIRIRGGNIEVATITLQKDDAQVIILANIHVSEARFWRAALEKIQSEEARGTVIFMEGIQDDGTLDEGEMTWERKLIVGVFLLLGQFYRSIPPVTNTQFLRDGLREEDNPQWQNVDVTITEFMESFRGSLLVLSAAYIGVMFGYMTALLHQRWLKPLLWVVCRIYMVFITGLLGIFEVFCLRKASNTASDSEGKPHKKGFTHLLIQGRNEVALAATEGHPRSLLVWGAAHVKGMVHALKARGYTIVDIEWFPAYRLWPTR